jgi:hypothetical protein
MMKSVLTQLVILLVLQSSSLFAQQEVNDSLVKEKIRYIEQALNKSKTNVNVWWYGWFGAYSAATVAQGAVYFASSDKATKQDMALGSATTILGAGLQLLTPLNTGHDADLISTLPENTPEELQIKLQKAEELFKNDAITEKAGRSWQIHALNEGMNLASGLITWLAFKRSFWDGVTNFVMNSAITETQIWTQPTRTLKDYRSYCRKYKSDEKLVVYQPQPEYFLRTYPGGVSFSIVF